MYGVAIKCCYVDLDSHALPAKEKMNSSFQNKSSSDEISETDAFVQISKEDILVGENISYELEEPSSCSQLKNEVRRADMDEWTDLSCTIPTDQVPALRETTDSTELEGCVGIANLAAVGKNIRTQTLVHAAANELYSKEEESMQPHQLHHKLQHPTQVWSLVPKAASIHHDSQSCVSEIKETHPGSVMSCQCLQFQNRLNLEAEAVCLKPTGQHLQQQSSRKVVIGGKVRGAGAGPIIPEPNDRHRHHFTVSEVASSFSESVISSSISAAVKDVKFPPSSPPTSSSPTTPPSLCGSSGTNVGSTCSAEQTSNANLVIHHGSSCSESLLHAQIQSETLGALSTQASENPVNSSDVQNQETVMQPSVNSSLGNGEGNCSSSSNICINLKGPLITSNVKQIGAHSDIPIYAAVAGWQYYPKNEGIIKSSFNKISYGGLPKQLSWSSYPQGPASNEGWGIPRGLGLLGGGESSLNSGTSGWGTPPSSNPNNNSGWGQNSSQNNPAQSQWGGGGVNRNGGGASQGPGGQQNTGNSNKGNQQTHQQSHNQGGGQQQSGQSSTSVSSRDNQVQQGGGQQNTQQQQGNNGPTSQSSQIQQQQNGSTSWAQAAGKGLPGGPSTQGTGGGGGSGGNGGPNGGSTSNSTTKQLEQLNSMREALFSQDGWGGQHVNQDTGWDIPASPEPGAKDSGAVWKPNVNNGTDLWEANLRNGGQPPPQQTQKTPWGHTPATNIGGTWGEDDDVGDSSNVWTGVPSSGGGGGGGGANMGNTGGPGAGGPGPGGAGAGGQWSGGSGGGAMWGAKKEPEWGAAGSNWGDSRDSRELRGGDPRDLRGGDPRDIRDVRELRGGGDIRGGGGDHRGAVDHRGVDPRDLRELRDPLMRDMRDIRDLPRELRGSGTTGDPRMGRINGGDLGGGGAAAAVAAAAVAMWGQQKGVGSSGGGGGVVGGPSQWAGPPPPQPKDMKPTGWEEPSPPTQRRNIPNYDDGTSLWGNPTQQPGKGETRKVSHWKEMPTPNMGRGGMQCPPGISQNRLPSGGSGGMKGDGSGPLWGHPSRNGSWGDPPHDTGNSGWGDDSKVTMGGGGVNSWNEPQLNPASWGGQKPKPTMNPAGWVEDNMDASSWSHNQKTGPKPLTKELVWASKQFRILSEIGYKKEDVENALRSTNMNLEDAHDLLNAGRLNLDAWRRHEDHSPFDLAAASHPGAAVAAAAAAAAGVFPGQRFNPVTQQMPFAPPGPGVGNAPSLLNNINNANPSLASINNISPAMVQKIFSQQPPPQQPPTQQPTPFQPTPRAPQNQPSAAQLRMLVQQIQMAVQAGYLNHQILNQPLAPQTLILLNQLLQQIKLLQQLMQQQTLIQVNPLGKGGSNTVLQISVQITKAKQQITNLQNQIVAQQALYVKQQQQQQHHIAATQGGGGPQSGGDYFKPPMHDPMAALHGNFGELAIKDPQVQATYQNQQSRLNQWKLPSLDKEGDVGAGSEFSRAPGTTSKSTLPQPNSSPNINPLLGQGDGTWSTVSRSSSDTGWPETSNNQSGDVVTGAQSDNKDSQWPTSVAPTNSAAFTDLVPEFEPGKPWKGTQMKSIEDDPTITPGSVVRSPLSLPTIKDTEIFGGGGGSGGAVVGGNKSSMPVVSSAMEAPIPPLSLSSSTWSFNPTSSAAPSSSFTSPLASKLGGAKSSWGDAPPPTPVTSELWGAPVGKSRGPPPGLSSKAASNGWGSLGGGSGGGSAVRSSGSSSWGIQGAPWGSTWLLLRNLTPQIDGSTLKTLCLQHGPLQSFHLYLNHELALAKYSTREEAAKAQGALNNCVLSNTTIFAESPAESEVHTLLQHLGHGAQQQQPQGGSSTPWGIRGGGAAPPVVAQNPQAHFAPVAPNSQAGQPPSKAAADAWGGGGGSQLWPTPSASSLWGAPQLDGGNDQHRATPSSLNSFLPGDLLGGESM